MSAMLVAIAPAARGAIVYFDVNPDQTVPTFSQFFPKSISARELLRPVHSLIRGSAPLPAVKATITVGLALPTTMSRTPWSFPDLPSRALSTRPFWPLKKKSIPLTDLDDKEKK
jgi:hypothetical protein